MGRRQALAQAWRHSKADNVSLLAAGVAFWGFLAVFPALIAAVTVYGLVSDPSMVQQQVNELSGSLPAESRQLIETQLTSITNGSGQALGVGLVISVLAALWSASGGVMNLMTATNIAYEANETRGFVKLRATALLLTLGAIVFVLVAVALVAVLPAVLNAAGLGSSTQLAVQVGRWAGLVLFVLVALAVVYRYAPNRDRPRMTVLSLGAVLATILWVIGSAAFSLYVSNFGSYGKTYGALAGVVILMLWMYLTSFIVLFGAEINAATERRSEAGRQPG